MNIFIFKGPLGQLHIMPLNGSKCVEVYDNIFNAIKLGQMSENLLYKQE